MRFYFITLLGSCLCWTFAAAQNVPLQVNVDGILYSVQDTSVFDQSGKQERDIFIIRKAALTANVLDSQILHSELNRQLFDVANRITVFADEASGRFIEPWRRPISSRPTGEEALAAAKAQFKAWAIKLAGDSAQAALAVVRRDYEASIDAYRHNAAIYRNVTRRREVLTYDEALQFLQNAPAIARLLYAKGLEAQLSGSARPSDSVTAPDPGGSARFSQRLQSEVISRVDAIKNAADLEKSSAAIRKIAVAEISPLKAYDVSVRPSIIRFNMVDAKSGGAGTANGAPAATTTGFVGQNVVRIAVPTPQLKAGQRLDITGGILPPPYPTRRQSPAAGNHPPSAPAASAQNGKAGGGGGIGAQGGEGPSPGGDSSNAAGAAPSQSGNGVPGSASADRSAGGSGISGDPDNLLTFSSKGYHTADGWQFDPLTALWVNPKDPAETRIPAIITCCDDTGLAFPNDAVEAQTAYWDGGGVDPNCGRLYKCTPDAGGGSTDPSPDAGNPTDKDAEILAVLNYIKSLPIPEEEKTKLSEKAILDLPGPYWRRALELRGQVFGRRAPRAAEQARVPAGPGGSSFRTGRYSNPTVNRSTITGLGGENSSHYEPATQSTAANMVAKYPVVPTCK